MPVNVKLRCLAVVKRFMVDTRWLRMVVSNRGWLADYVITYVITTRAGSSALLECGHHVAGILFGAVISAPRALMQTAFQHPINERIRRSLPDRRPE
jgi:hypothetical protein